MNTTLHLAKHFLKIIFRGKNSVLTYIILPIIGLLIPMILFGNSQATLIRVGIVDADKSSISSHLTSEIGNQQRFKISTLDEEEINNAITEGTLDCALVIPKGFSQGFLEGQHKQLKLLSIQGVSATGWVEGFLKTYLPNVKMIADASNADTVLFEKIYTEYATPKATIVQKRIKNIITGLSITYLGIGFLIQFMLIGSLRTAAFIIKERKEKTLARIKCSPSKGFQFILGNTIVNVGLIFLQALLSLLILRYVLQVDMGVSVFSILLVLLPLVFSAAGLTLLMVSFANNEAQLNNIANMVIFPTCLISGCFWDIRMMPEFMQKLALFFPQRWALDGIERLMFGEPLSSIYANLAILCAFALAFFALAIFGFNRQNTLRA